MIRAEAPEVEVLGSDYPHCKVEGCNKLAQDGYCEASCCAHLPKEERTLCNGHSHRPQLVLDALGFPADKESYSRADVLRIARAMWMGASLVIESGGYFGMLRDLKAKRLAVGCDACRQWKPAAGAAVAVVVSKCEHCGRVLRATKETA